MSERNGDVVKLPSVGLPYNGVLPGGSITVYSMRTSEEALFGGLTKQSDIETVIDTLIARCTSLPNELKPGDLYGGDRLYLWLMIRAASYGAMYSFRIACPECRAGWEHTIDLTKDLEVREADPQTWEDPFKLELPSSGDVISLKLFRGSDERSVIKYVDQQNRRVNIKLQGDPGYTYRLALHVESVEMRADPSKSFSRDAMKQPGALIAEAVRYIEQLDARDSSAIRDELDARTPSVSLMLSLDCPKCNAEFQTVLPTTASFFRTGTPSRSYTTPRTLSH